VVRIGRVEQTVAFDTAACTASNCSSTAYSLFRCSVLNRCGIDYRALQRDIPRMAEKTKPRRRGTGQASKTAEGGALVRGLTRAAPRLHCHPPGNVALFWGTEPKEGSFRAANITS
jgi:hypothetical protein